MFSCFLRAFGFVFFGSIQERGVGVVGVSAVGFGGRFGLICL